MSLPLWSPFITFPKTNHDLPNILFANFIFPSSIANLTFEEENIFFLKYFANETGSLKILL
mgnify:CR=1 FL=1